VSSVGWIENPLSLPYSADNGDIAIGRHAVAIDERRAFFRTNLWRPRPDGGPKDLKQVWFPGVHCDVGGGYPETRWTRNTSEDGTCEMIHAKTSTRREKTSRVIRPEPASVQLEPTKPRFLREPQRSARTLSNQKANSRGQQ
jgi:uncharacterized protein (DUF2235 family)